MVSAAEIDALCVQETAIVDLGGTRGTVDLNDTSTQVPALPGSDVLGNPHSLTSAQCVYFPSFNTYMGLGTHVQLSYSGVEAHNSEQKKSSSPGLHTV